MIPARLNLICPQGSTFKKTFKVYDENNAAVDLTGYTGAMQARKKYTSTSFLFQATTDVGGGMTISSNIISVNVPYSDTTLFPAGDYVWDIEITSPANDRDRILQGTLTVTPEVTK